MKTLKVKSPPMRGRDVETVQRELKRRRFFAGKIDGVFGPLTAAAVYRAKLELGYSKPDHVAGDLLLAYLTGRRKPTGTMIRLAHVRKSVPKPKPGETSPKAHRPTKAEKAALHEAAVRAKAVRVMRALLKSEPRIHYRQIRPMATRTIRTFDELERRLRSSVAMDCSESHTLIARLAGAKDPNASNFDGTGYTGTILHGKIIPRRQSKAGDAWVFGPGTGHHVCTALEDGADPMLFSHGQEKGPFAIRASTEARYQAAPIRVVRLAV